MGSEFAAPFLFGPFVFFPCCFCCIGPLLLILWIWMLIDCLTKEPSEGNDKVIWVLVIIFAHWIGALIYLLVRRPQRIAKYGR
jgi:hypothetical protein